ncbi:MAG TPA: class I SAM-dependent methyltransferase [Pirellulales bacterium]|nr:class I SAM-dependent methyltransferase [Pirellulales bacterium]
MPELREYLNDLGLMLLPGRWSRRRAERQRGSDLLREFQRLSDLRSVACDVTALRSLTRLQIGEMFKNHAIDAEWRDVERTLGTLELPEFTGGVNPGDQRAIYYLIRYLRPSRVLEIGTHIGCSTLSAALALNRIRNLDNTFTPALVSVDIRDVNDETEQPWMQAGASYSPARMLELARCRDVVDFAVCPSLEFLTSRCDTAAFDFIFLDGDHSAPTVYQEFPAALRRLAPGGLILLHDYFPNLSPLWSNNAVVPGVFLGLQRLLNEGAEFSVLPLGELPWPTKLGSCVTSLALAAATGRNE